MKLTVDILDDFISSLYLGGAIDASSNDGTNTIIEVPYTYHAREGMTISIDLGSYEIISVVNNVSITLSGVINDPIAYEIPKPKYFHGTPLMVNANHISGAKPDDKVPMIYLYEIIREVDKSENSRVKKEADLRLFFLDEANFSEWTTNNHYSKRLLGLNNLVDKFIESAKKYSCCFYLYETDFTRINHANWGIYQNNQGHIKKVFDDDLTGVELDFTLPLIECN